MSEFVRVGAVGDFPEQRGTAVRIGEKKVAVFKIDGKFHAIQDWCPHMGASLADGRVSDGHVTCFWHGWRFDLVSGQGDQRSKQWLCARVYEVRVDGNDVYVRWSEDDSAQTSDDDDDDDDGWVAWDDKFLKRDESD